MAPPRGWHHTPEQRAKIRAAATGKLHSPNDYPPEVRAKIADARRGKALSPEHCAKLRAAALGNRHMREAPIKGRCVYCGGLAQSLDHVIPRGRIGWDDPRNVVHACYVCNSSKGQRTPEEWMTDSAPHH
jgi:5-methylcytosine-specific restriction endonuclease McrA